MEGGSLTATWTYHLITAGSQSRLTISRYFNNEIDPVSIKHIMNRTATIPSPEKERVNMPQVRPGSSGRWARRSASAAPDYKEGIETSPNNWEANTVAAHDSYKAGVMKAANENRQMAGVKRSGQAWWKKRATEVGPGRFAEGVQGSEETYKEGVGPYLAEIEKTKLPPRGPKGAPQNYERVKVQGMALRALKERGGK